MRKVKSLLLTILFIILLTKTSFLLASPLLSAMDAQKSVVLVYAKRIEMRSSPNAEARIHAKTGRMQVVQKKFVAQRTQKGAGIIISTSGLIVTNYHTINGANKLGITLYNGKKVGAKIVHVMPEYDLALIKINPPYALAPITFGDSNHVKLGDNVTHIGNSSLLKQTISGGIVTGIGHNKFKNIPITGPVELIQVNINIYKGDSGGPLFNAKGELIGVMVAKKITKDRTSFAIPSNKIKKLYLNFLK